MNIQLVAVLIQEGSRMFSGWLQTRPMAAKPSAVATEEASPASNVTAEKATAIATGCVPCALGHLGTCTGLLNEAVRFARSDGISSTEVIDRANMCLDELNAMERKDLRPQMIDALPAWEKELASKALTESRSIRHELENLGSSDQLEHLAAETQTVRQDIGRSWFKIKLAKMTPAEQAEIQERVMKKLKEGT